MLAEEKRAQIMLPGTPWLSLTQDARVFSLPLSQGCQPLHPRMYSTEKLTAFSEQCPPLPFPSWTHFGFHSLSALLAGH